MNKLLLLTAAIALAGCAVGPDYKTPTNNAPSTFSSTDSAYVVADPNAQFWQVFDDETLNGLVTYTLRNNHDLRIALANLNQARALRHAAQFDLLPTPTIRASHLQARVSGDEQLSALSSDPKTTTLNRGSFDAVWELDLFGRLRRNLEASSASEQAIAADLRAAQISVVAEVARSYFELRGAQEQLVVAQRNADNQTETLHITEVRFNAGRGNEFDIARAQVLLNNTRATLPGLHATIENNIHRLSVLVGEQPNALADMLTPTAALPELPRLVQIGKPADLLRRRPDINAAERRLAAATANIGVAEADWFPRVSFTGEIGFAANSVDRIGNSSTSNYAYGPSLQWGALDFGHVRARVNVSKASEQGALAQYEKAVLQALEETENALVSYRETRHQLDYLGVSAQASKRATELARKRFEGGATDFLDVLDSERSQLEAEANLSQARTAAATGLVALYKALGGGWDGTELAAQ